MIRQLLIGLLFLGLGACVHQSSGISGKSEGADGQPVPSFSQFSDIPVPTGSTMDVDRTLLLGSNDAWIGRMVLSNRKGASETFDFYKAEMPGFGWQEVTSVRAATSVLTYKRGERVATIQIEKNTLMGSTVFFTVSPQGSGNPR